jgi:hypothetical protein
MCNISTEPTSVNFLRLDVENNDKEIEIEKAIECAEDSDDVVSKEVARVLSRGSLQLTIFVCGRTVALEFGVQQLFCDGRHLLCYC